LKALGSLRRTIWPSGDARAVWIIDQCVLPHRFETRALATLQDAVTAIRDMWVRGAPLIGVTAAYGLALQARTDAGDAAIATAAEALTQARPTAVNLAWAVQRMRQALGSVPPRERADVAWQLAGRMADEDAATNEAIGRHGLPLLQAVAERRGGVVDVLTHCNAGWLATVDWGTALAPVYQAQAAGIDVHVWVDETRPRNQGAALTAWELGQQGVRHTVVTDNAGGHLMQHGQVDIVVVGCDRVTRRGDTCNKVGTYLKALAAHDNGLPFYVAMPWSTLDTTLDDGLREVPIEQRAAREVTHLSGRLADGRMAEVQLVPDGSAAANPAFDVTPARLVSAFITERGVLRAADLARMAAAAA